MDSKMKTKSTKNASLKSTSKNPFADVAVISLNDFQRIQNATKTINVQEEHNNQKIFKVQTDQKFSTQRNLKERIKEIDYEKHLKEKSSNADLDEQTTNKLLEKAKNNVELGFDDLKEMEKLKKYSKVACIRKKQIEQTEMMKKEYMDQNRKMAEMMELDRLKELKFNEEQKEIKRKQQYLGALVINDQIKDKEIERIRAKEHQEKERQMMLKQIKELKDEEERNKEMKKQQIARMAVETMLSNKKAAEIKDQRKYEDLELDLKMIQYVIEKGKKEEDELAEKK